MATEKVYKRILLKLSGEALTGDESFGIDPKVLDQMALEIGQLVGIGVQVALSSVEAISSGVRPYNRPDLIESPVITWECLPP